MQLLRNNTFMSTNSEITLDVISEVLTRYLIDCKMGTFRVDLCFPFIYWSFWFFQWFPQFSKKKNHACITVSWWELENNENILSKIFMN